MPDRPPHPPPHALGLPEPTSAALAGWPIRIEVPVYWGEMDSYEHLNNTVYLRHFESVRVVWFERIGLDRMKDERGIGGILAETRCRFRAPVTYPDRLVVAGRTVELGEDRFRMEYRIHSLRLDRTAAEGEGTIVIYDYRAGRKTAIPADLRAAIERLDPGLAG